MIQFTDLNKSHATKETFCSIVAVGGIPIENGQWLGKKVTQKDVRSHILKSLGLGAVLTPGNPRGLSNLDLGKMCVLKGHTWTFHTVNVTIAFFNVPMTVRHTFANDGRFHMSWVECADLQPHQTFTASANLKVWKKLVKRKDCPDWNVDQRHFFGQAIPILTPILPRYFNT